MNKSKQYKIAKKVGAFLKYTRMNKNISISKIAADLKLNPSTIVSIENCKNKASFINVVSMISYLKVDNQKILDFIFTNEELECR